MPKCSKIRLMTGLRLDPHVQLVCLLRAVAAMWGMYFCGEGRYMAYL